MEGNDLHTNKLRKKKQSEKTRVSSRAKKSGRLRDQEMKDEKQRLKELETSIRSQVAAEERAHQLVERLVLEDEITKEFLINAGNFITSSHYADVVEERMLSKKCGYPLCNNEMNQISSQKYKISVKTNRVYDITERKCFCSNFCFKASKYFESQISDSPVWTRLGESPKTFILLEMDSNTNRTGAGNVLVGNKGKQGNISGEIKEDHVTEYEEHDDIDLVTGIEGRLHVTSTGIGQELSHENYSEGSSTAHLSTLFSSSSSPLTRSHDQSLDKPGQLLGKPDQSFDKPGQLLDKPDQSLQRSSGTSRSKSRLALKKERIQDDKERSLSRDSRTVIQSVQAVFEEWCTHSTLEYLGLSSKRDTNSAIPEANEQDSFATKVTRFYQPAVYVQDNSDSDSETGASPKTASDDIVIEEKKRLNTDPVYIVPPIDSKSQMTIRRRIVLDKLYRTLPDLLSEVKLTVGEISRDLTELVHTFSLSSKNVTLKPLQWKILSLALILILERRNSLITQALDSSKESFHALLARLEITRGDLDLVLSPLSSFEPQHSGHFKSAVSDDEYVKTFEPSEEENEVVFKERNDYGDMEELD